MSAGSDTEGRQVVDLMREGKTPVVVGLNPENLSDIVLSIKYDKRLTYQYGGYHRLAQISITKEQAEELLHKLVFAVDYVAGEEDE